MISPPDVARFLVGFRHFGEAPSVESYMALFHPEAQLYDESMPRPIGVAEIPEHIRGVLALVKGFRMRIERWRAAGGRVFVEAANGGEIAGTAVGWRAVYRIQLDGWQGRDGRRYFDRAPLLARLDPALPRLDLMPPAGEPHDAIQIVRGTGADAEQIVARCAEAWRDGRPEAIAALYREDASFFGPGLARPLARGEVGAYYRGLARELRGARLTPRSWAGDDALLFIEWQATVPTPAGQYALGLVERFDLVDGAVLAARAYFESAALARALADPART